MLLFTGLVIIVALEQIILPGRVEIFFQVDSL